MGTGKEFDKDYYEGPNAYMNYKYDEHYIQFIDSLMVTFEHINPKLCECCDQQYFPKSFLDVGCALGYHMKALKEWHSHRPWNVELTGIDISEWAVMNADKSVSDTIGKGNILQIPYGDNKFDVVMAKDILEHIPEKDIDRALYELKRVSKRWVVISAVIEKVEWDKDETHVTIKPLKWWMDKLKKHGLGYVETRINQVGFWEPVFVCEIIEKEKA